MKVIVSAFACDPQGGSEGGVGWNAVNRIARRHDVRVITSRRVERHWKEAAAAGRVPNQVRVRFIGTEADWHSNPLVGRAQS
jgi:nucleoside-diphosphate-sugar epimerase